MVTLLKRYRFHASHRLHAHALSDEENASLFGKCNNPFGHGHNYTLEVAVAGPVDARTGMVLPRGELDRLVEDAVLSRLDYTYMNCDVDEFRELVPTTENIIATIRSWLDRAWRERFSGTKARLERIVVEETPRNIFELTCSDERVQADAF